MERSSSFLDQGLFQGCGAHQLDGCAPRLRSATSSVASRPIKRGFPSFQAPRYFDCGETRLPAQDTMCNRKRGWHHTTHHPLPPRLLNHKQGLPLLHVLMLYRPPKKQHPPPPALRLQLLQRQTHLVPTRPAPLRCVVRRMSYPNKNAERGRHHTRPRNLSHPRARVPTSTPTDLLYNCIPTLLTKPL